MKGFAVGRTWAIAKKELFHLRRDRLTTGMVAGIPVIMTLLFGYAINTDVRHLRAAVVDEANTAASRALVLDAQASQVIDVVAYVAGVHELERKIAAAEISIGIFLPADFEERLLHGRPPFAQLLVDDSDPIVLGAIRGLLRMPVSGDRLARSRDAFEIRPLFNPERRTAVFIVPGLCGVILTLTMVLFTSIAIVRERERGNLELLITTPVRPLELMIGKLAPYVAIGYIQLSLILLLGIGLFDIPVRGPLQDLYLGTGLFVLSTLTLGLIISTLADNQFQAFQLTFMTFLPQLLLSGFMFPFEGMPRAAQLLAELFPLTHFLRIVRGILLRDASLVVLDAQLWPLAAFFIFGMLVATLRFRKRLD